MKFQSNAIFNGTITANSVADAGTNTDKFLVLTSGGLVNYRTAAELYADLGIGALPAGSTETLKHQVKTGVALTKGQAVYITSADGTNMIVGKASNDAESTSSKTLGLIETSLSINGIGNVVTEGLLAGLDTTGANAAGDPVWLGTNGNLIYGLANKPSAPSHLVFIGIVTRINLNNGEIFVKVQNGFELDELHNVDLKTTTPINGHILGYNGTLWVNKTIAGWLGFTPADDSLVLHKAGAETITGNKSFDASPYFNTGIGLKAPSGIYQYIGGLNSGIAMTVGSATQSLLFSTSTNYTYTFPNSDGTIALLSNIPTLSGLGGVPTSRTITINGTTYDLSANRSWSITSMVYPAAGIAVSTGTAWGTSITDNSSNWNTAYGWGNHASAGYVPGARTLTINGTTYDLSADRSWTISTSASARSIQKFTATANQTAFTITGGYTPGLVDVFQNGVKLDNSGDFTATDGSVVTLATGAAANDIIEVYKYITAFIANNSLRQVTSFTATAGQTSFSVTYSLGYVDVFYNGSKLAASEYTATSGTAIVLATACFANDIVEVIAYNYAVGAFTGIGGSGTANYIPKFTASGTIANSTIYDNGRIGIGTNSPTSDLTVYNASSYTDVIKAGGGANGRYLYSYVDSYGVGLANNASFVGESIYFNVPSNYIAFSTLSAERLRINSNGTVSIGNTNSTYNLDVTGTGRFTNIITAAAFSTPSTGSAGSTTWNLYHDQYAAGDFGIWAGSTNRLLINAAGNVGIGTSNPYVKLNVNGLAQFGNPNLQTSGAEYIIVGQNSSTGPDDGNCASMVAVHAAASGSPQAKWGYQFRQNDNSGANLWGDAVRVTKEAGSNSTYTAFYTNSTIGQGTERMRITSAGRLLIGTTTVVSTNYAVQATSAGGGFVTNAANSGDASFYSTTGTIGWHFYAEGGGSTRMYVLQNGDVRNANNSYGAISDISLKENIIDATPKLDDLLKVKIRNYNFISDETKTKQIGVIAQELEEIFPGMISEDKQMGTEETIKTVKYSVFVPMLIKAVQELKAEIEQLKAK